MKITVTFDSLDEMYAHMRLNAGFEPIPATLNSFEAAAEKTQALAAEDAQELQEAPEGFQPAENTPFDEQPQETPAGAITEDFRVEVRKMLAKLNKSTGRNTAGKLIKEIGVSSGKLTDVPLETLPTVMEKAKEAYNAS